MNINAFLNSLAANNSRNFKLEQLEAHVDNGTLREVVRLALDPFTQFYIRKIPAYTSKMTIDFVTLPEAISQLFSLSSRMLTGNAGIEHLRFILEMTSPDDAKVIERIIQKDLKCGVDTSSANKVWPGLIPVYPVMLCSPFEQKLVDKIKFPAYAQMKMDGMRFNAIVKNGAVEYRSRNGKELHLLGNLDDQFLAMANGGDYVFDGELLVMLPGDHQFADRQTGNGILNKANKGTISAEEAALIHASVWDVIPYVLFCDSYCGAPYSKRFSQLRTMLESVKVQGKRIWNVTSTIVETIDQAQEIFQEYLALGHEGIILKDGNGIWEDKRAKHQIKFKGELECDLRIVGIEEGTGKYKGMLGAIICESEDGIVKTRCGSGFNDEQRKTLGQEIVGKIVAIKYNMRSVDKQGKQSLFLPIVLEIREDKSTADTSDTIK
jgi:hypothetical protein